MTATVPHVRRLAAAATAAALIAGALIAAPASAAPPRAVDPTNPDFGANVKIFSPATPLAEIQSYVDTLANQQRNDEMGTNRQSVLFLPGEYGTAQTPLKVEVGYYTEVAGLGASPTDVDINGGVEVYNRCLENNGTSNCLALVNFWRTISNLSIDITDLPAGEGCRSGNFWAVSQAVSMRRVDIAGSLVTLMDYCTAGPQYASGGFIADSRLPNTINGSQQQWLTRNSEVTQWSNAVWNQVFSGVVGRSRMTRPSRLPRTRPSTRRRSVVRSRTSTSTPTGATTSACPRCSTTPVASRGPTARRRGAASRSPTSTSRSRPTR